MYECRRAAIRALADKYDITPSETSGAYVASDPPIIAVFYTDRVELAKGNPIVHQRWQRFKYSDPEMYDKIHEYITQ